MITSASNPKIKLVRALQARRSTREKERLFVVEGVRLVEEALRAQVPAQLALHTDHLDRRGRAALARLARQGVQIEAVSSAVMAAVSDTQTSQGLLAVLPFASLSPAKLLSFVLVLDRLADPGNLGTILRTADAVGVEVIFLAPGTVDVYNPKVVRAAMGAHFHLSILEASWDELARHLAGLNVWLAESHQGEPYDRVDWRQPCALIVGSEASGPSEAARQFAPRRVHVPMRGNAESLNAAVAAGVLLFEAARQKGLLV